MKFRALEARTLPPLRRSVAADEVFEIDENGPFGDYAKGLLVQIDALKEQGYSPWLEDVTPAKRPTKEKD